MKNLLIFFGIVLATNLAFAQNTPTSCVQSNSMDFNATELSGIWWEVARNPSSSFMSLNCVKVNFTVQQPQNILDISTTYSNTPSYLWVNQTMYANISLDNSNNNNNNNGNDNGNGNSNGYNITYINGITLMPSTVYKLLDTDYQNYALICGYTNASDDSTAFGIVLTRDRYPNTTTLNGYEATASTQYADFLNGTMSLITQSPTCYAAGAASQYSIFATMLAVLYAMAHFTL